MVKYLIVNADDFGISEQVNETIITAHRQGIVTSTSLMVSGEGVESAVRLAKENPSLGVGLHLVLCCGKSILPPPKSPIWLTVEVIFLTIPLLLVCVISLLLPPEGN